MAFLKQSTKSAFTNFILEDPRPSSTAIYILGDAHDYNSLSPIFGKYSITTSDGFPGTQVGFHNFSTAFSEMNWSGSWSTFATLMLTKGNSTVQQLTQTGNNTHTNLWPNWLLSIDPQYEPKGSNFLTDGINNGLFFYYSSIRHPSISWTLFTNVPESRELYDNLIPIDSSLNVTTIASTVSPRTYFPYIDSVTKRIPAILVQQTLINSSAGAVDRASNVFRLGYIGDWPALVNASGTSNSLSLNNWTGQFLGPAADGKPLYFLINASNDQEQRVLSYNMSNNTTTYLHQYSSTRSAFGGAVGGTRSTAAGIRNPNKLASSFFNDPSAANTKGFYVPYFDTANNYQPYYIQWNKTTDVFTRNEDINVYENSNRNSFSASSQYLNDLTGDPGDLAGYSSWVFNETFTVTTNSVTTRYLILGAVNGQYQIYDSSNIRRGFITYEVDSTDPKKLIYHSHFFARETPRNIVWLNDDKTSLGIFHYQSFVIYNFSESQGWVETQSISERFWSVGRDRSDRIWGVASYGSSQYTALHLITPSMPVKINIVPEQSIYNFEGSVINSYFTLEAINSQGSRIESNITLVIDGTTMTFEDNTKSKIVQTSTAQTTQVNVKIVDSGFSQIITSVTV
jgi:hypothetical protein